MITRIRQLVRSPFTRSTVTLQLGVGAGMVVQAVAGILLARWLGPEMFGQYALAFSLAAIGSVVLGAGAFDALIPHVARAWAGEDRSGVRPALAFLAKFVLIAAIIALLIGLVMPRIASIAYGDIAVGWYAFAILAAAAVSTTFFEFGKLATQVTGRIRSLSLLTFGDQGLRFSWALGLVLAGAGVAGAAVGHLFGTLTLAVIAIFVWRSIARSEVDWPSVRETVRRAIGAPLRGYLGDTLWVLGDRNLAMLYAALPVALTGLFVSATEVAYFKVALGYITLAMSVMTPISILLNSRFPEIQATRPATLRREFIRVTGYAVLLTAAVTIVVVALAPWMFRFLYGPQYDVAIPYAQLFAVHGILFGLGVALGPMWRALSRVRVSIAINIITLGAGVPLGIYFLQGWGITGAVGMVTLWYLSSHLISFLYLVRELNRR